MTIDIIDGFEAVEVDQTQIEGGALCQVIIQGLEEGPAIGQAGKSIKCGKRHGLITIQVGVDLRLDGPQHGRPRDRGQADRDHHAGEGDPAAIGELAAIQPPTGHKHARDRCQ